MPRDFSYEPRFVDIRIKPPKEEEAKAHERECDWASCRAPGTCKAPMGPDRLNEYYWFCPAHAAQYNKQWDFFADMSEAQMRAYQESQSHGHRPTWRMGAQTGPQSNEKRAQAGFAHAFEDTFGLFGRQDAKEAPRQRRLGKLEARAMDHLGLNDDATPEDVRAAYAKLVKRFHPDANRGDRSCETRFQEVVEAYKILKQAGLG